MTRTELNEFRVMLEQIQTELGNGNRNREALAVEASPDELDRIQHAHDRDFAMSNLEHNLTQLRKVRAALGRMDAGIFGTCAGCQEDINPRRLAAVPSASLCLPCQETADRRHTPHGREMETRLGRAA